MSRCPLASPPHNLIEHDQIVCKLKQQRRCPLDNNNKQYYIDPPATEYDELETQGYLESDHKPVFAIDTLNHETPAPRSGRCSLFTDKCSLFTPSDTPAPRSGRRSLSTPDNDNKIMIVSWNTEKKSEKDMIAFVSNHVLNKWNLAKASTLCVCLQECKLSLVSSKNKLLRFLDKLCRPLDCKFNTREVTCSSSFAPGFGLATIVLSMHEKLVMKNIQSRVFGNGRTKGYLAVDVHIPGKYTVTVVNTHLPFKDNSHPHTYFDKIKQHLTLNETTYLVGDVNSRIVCQDVAKHTCFTLTRMAPQPTKPVSISASLKLCKQVDYNKFIKWLKQLPMDEPVVVVVTHKSFINQHILDSSTNISELDIVKCTYDHNYDKSAKSTHVFRYTECVLFTPVHTECVLSTTKTVYFVASGTACAGEDAHLTMQAFKQAFERHTWAKQIIQNAADKIYCSYMRHVTETAMWMFHDSAHIVQIPYVSDIKVKTCDASMGVFAPRKNLDKFPSVCSLLMQEEEQKRLRDSPAWLTDTRIIVPQEYIETQIQKNSPYTYETLDSIRCKESVDVDENKLGYYPLKKVRSMSRPFRGHQTKMRLPGYADRIMKYDARTREFLDVAAITFYPTYKYKFDVAPTRKRRFRRRRFKQTSRTGRVLLRSLSPSRWKSKPQVAPG